MLQITSCDAILANMETMLGGFQEGLGAISAEIRGLQQQSSALSCQLNNRTAAQVPLQLPSFHSVIELLCSVGNDLPCHIMALETTIDAHHRFTL